MWNFGFQVALGKVQRAQEGELRQIDAAKHAWPERSPEPFLRRMSVPGVMQEGFGRYGLPQVLYSDKHTIFSSPKMEL